MRSPSTPYEENGYVFVFSPTPAEGTPGPPMSRVSRFQTGLEHPRQILPGSERVIIEWPSGGHNGGEAIIGPDGYLYIGTGDGTSGSDVNNSGQGVNDLLSVIMRIDVDHPDPGRNYSIPKDNPFVNYPGARPEIWAFGFRNPWRMSFDPETGRLWVGDVGQDLWEMIWVGPEGGELRLERPGGEPPVPPAQEGRARPDLPPVVEHHHTECRSITGGYVYHGAKFPELRGAYVYGDYQYGKIWGLRYDGQKVTWHEELADTAVFIASFAVGRDGDIYAIDNSTGFIHALERTPPSSDDEPVPEDAERDRACSPRSRTGGMAPGRHPLLGERPVLGRRGARGAVPRAPRRHADRRPQLLGPTPTAWSLVQTLSLDLEEGDPRSRAPVETRILVKQDEHWMGYTYLWNDAGPTRRSSGRTGPTTS